jgi:hypothetical protein
MVSLDIILVFEQNAYPYGYKHVLAQTLYEPWFVLLRVLNLVWSVWYNDHELII